MSRPPLEHRFVIDGDPYCLVEYTTRGGERRIQEAFALRLAKAPSVIDALDGANLYAEAVAQECLKQAPESCWRLRTTDDVPNHWDARRVVSLDQYPLEHWAAFRREVDAFLASLPRLLPATPPSDPGALPADAPVVADPHEVPAVFRGRAE